MDSKLTQGPGGHQGGYVLVAVVALTTVLLATGIAFMRWSTDEATQSRESVAAMQAYYLAQMGVVEQGFTYLRSVKETELPTGTLPMPGKHVMTDPDGYYEKVELYGMPSINQGDYWLEDRRFRITAVGRIRIPYFEQGMSSYKDVRRKAVLYIQIRSFADYMYLSECEQTRLGEYIRFWHGDTLMGRVHSNSVIAIMQDPQFYDEVSTTAPDFEHGTGYNPGFHGPAPIFNAPPVLVPDSAINLRIGASVSGHYYTDPNITYRVSLRGDQAIFFEYTTGTPFDSLTATRVVVPIVGKTCMFFERPVELYGHLSGKLTIGSSENIYLIDNIYYDDVPLIAHGYRILPGWYNNFASFNILGIVSEKEVKIANTWANGREDSHHRGNAQPSSDSTDIVIMGAIVALGESFTFEQQNDPDSGYVYQYPLPGNFHTDDRGQIFLLGSVTQWRRGYVHRSNNGSTGYLKQYNYDLRFRKVKPPCFFHAEDKQLRALFNITQWGQANPDVDDTQNWRLTRYN